MFDTNGKSCNNIVLSFLLFWMPLIVWMGVIFYGSSFPGKDVPCLFEYQDVVFHFIEYFILGFLFARIIKRDFKVSKNRLFLFSGVFGLLYGLSDEFHQTFVPGRTAAVSDLTVDTVGALMGGLVFRWLK